jgi:hypothetical protein
MRRFPAFWLPGLCLLGTGCGPFLNATRTLVIEPLHYCERGENLEELLRDRKLAENAWQGVAGCSPHPAYAPDYERGFKDGFADYLYAGGTGEPPPLPPRDYWELRYKSPEGRQAVEDWFAGFRHGAAAARASGFRQFVTVPASVPPPGPPGAPPAAAVGGAPPEPDGLPVLPPPRPLMPPANGGAGADPMTQPASPPGPPAPASGN